MISPSPLSLSDTLPENKLTTCTSLTGISPPRVSSASLSPPKRIRALFEVSCSMSRPHVSLISVVYRRLAKNQSKGFGVGVLLILNTPVSTAASVILTCCCSAPVTFILVTSSVSGSIRSGASSSMVNLLGSLSRGKCMRPKARLGRCLVCISPARITLAVA